MGVWPAMLGRVVGASGLAAIAIAAWPAVGAIAAAAPAAQGSAGAIGSETPTGGEMLPPWGLGLGLLGGGALIALSGAWAGQRRRPLAQVERQQLENYLRPLVEAANLTYWEIDLASETIWLFGHLTQPHSPATGITLTQDEFLAQYIPPEQAKELYQGFQSALATSGCFSLEHPLKPNPSTNQSIWMTARGKILADSAGQPRSVVGVSFDNTNHKRLALGLTASETLLTDILDNASVALAQLRAYPDGSWHYDYFSAGHRQVYGFSNAEFLANPDLWCSRVHPDDLATLVRPLQEEVIFAARAATIEVRFQHQDGLWRYIGQTYTSRRDQANDCWIVVVVSQDITQVKQTEVDLRTSEARFRSLAANLPGVIYRYEHHPATGHQAFTYMSPAALEIFGHPPDAIKDNVQLAWERVHAEDVPGLVEAIAASIETLGPWRWQGRITTPDGTMKWVQGIAKPEQQPDGTIVWDGFLLDITSRKAADLALTAERDLLDSVMSTSVAAITVLDPEGRIVFANSRAETVLGLTLDDLTQLTDNASQWRSTALGGPWPDEQQPFNLVLSTGEPVYDIRRAIEWPDGQRRALSINGAPVKDAKGDVVRLVFTINDITDQIEAETALRTSEAQLRLITDNMSDLVCLHEPDGIYTYVSPSCEGILGFTQAELVGQNPYDFFHPEDCDRLNQTSHQPALQGNATASTYRIRCKGGEYIWLETLTRPIFNAVGQVTGLQTTSRNVTEKIAIQAQLEYDAGHDVLTGLPNRSRLLQQIDAAIDLARQQRQPCAVLFIDLDRFKVINDSLGHHIGDELLVAIAQKLNRITRPQDVAARLSGDEFVVLLNQVTGVEQAIQVADRLLVELRQPFALKDRDVFVTASIGIALCTPRHQTGVDLLRDADIAMYRAKAGGKGRYALFDPQMHLQVLREMHLEEALRRAIEHQELILHYQPIVSLGSGQIKGFEVLARWPHSQYGMISPAEFIPIAEETGLILPLGRWVLRTACQQFSRWRQQFPVVQAMGLSINLSAVQLHDANLVVDLTELLTHLGLPSDCLTLEITESLLIKNVEYNLTVLEQIRHQGIRLSIDDFGTGYSSLSYLQRFPFSGLKVDRSFVTHLGTEAENPVLVKSILALADSLRLDPIAEGIETEKQLEFLQVNGCRYGQGYLFYKPMPASQIELLLAAGATDSNSCLPQ